MSCTELINRSEALLKKYEKYDGEEREPREKSDDPFMDQYLAVMDRVQDLNLKAEEVAQEKNRALKAALNAELRKAKASLMETEVPALEKLVKKGKKLSTEQIEERLRKVDEVRQAIDDIADGVRAGNRKPQRAYANGSGAGGSRGEITLNMSNMDGRIQQSDYYKHTEETRAFQQEFEMAKQRQDRQLESIEKGLSTLKDIGNAMHETLQQHDILIDAIDEKMDSVTKDLTTNNMKLKGIVTKVRSTRNFFIDLILICILLAIGLYIYNTLK